MNPKPQQAKLPAGWFLRRRTTFCGPKWEVSNADSSIELVTNQPNPKTAVDHALARLKREAAEDGEVFGDAE